MSEHEWQSTTDPDHLLSLLPASVPRRTLLLLACACARRVWSLVKAESDRSVLPALEALLEPGATLTGETLASGIVTVGLALARSSHHTANRATHYNTFPRPLTAVRDLLVLARLVRVAEHPGHKEKRHRLAERRAQRQLIHDIIGNPFRTPTFAPSWRTADVVGLARTAEELASPSGALDRLRLTVLADALEEAGCDRGDLLDHLRGGTRHARGCWVLGLILGEHGT